jgi:hypothetical protein
MSNTPATIETIERYVQFWNTDASSQRDVARHVFNPLVRYRAPIGERHGIDELVSLAADFNEHLGALTLTARHEPEIRDDAARLRWQLLRDGDVFAEGTDILTFDRNGNVAAVDTYLDRAPDGFDPHAHH